MSQLYLHQELCLLAIDDSKGTFEGGMYLYGFAGAILAELLLKEKVEAKDWKNTEVKIIDRAPLGDEILDEALKLISESKKEKKLQNWVYEVARIPKLKERIANQLVEQRILKRDEGKILWLFNKTTYPEVDGTYEDAIRARMAKFMFSADEKVDNRTAVLIAFASHAHLLKANFASVELKQHATRIEEIVNGSHLADATKAAMAAANAAIMVAVMVPAITAATLAN